MAAAKAIRRFIGEFASSARVLDSKNAHPRLSTIRCYVRFSSEIHGAKTQNWGANSCSRALVARQSQPPWRRGVRRLLLSATARGGVEPMMLKMPALSPTMEEGTIVKWLVEEGDEVSAGDQICEIETDKAVVSMEVERDGIIAKIMVPEGMKNIPLGKLIALMVDVGEDPSQVEVPVVMTEDVKKEEKGESEEGRDQVVVGEASSLPLSPAVRFLIDSNDLDPTTIPASGPKHRLLKGDVLQYLEDLKTGRVKKPVQKVTEPVMEAPKPVLPVQSEVQEAPYTDIPLDGMRKTIAKRLSWSKSSMPYSYASMKCCIDNLLELRRKLKSEGKVLTINDFLIKAVATTLTRLPQTNAVWNGNEVQQLSSVDISVAVATDGGLITPIVRDAGRSSVEGISATMKELAERARSGKLKPEEFQGGSFTLSNLGAFGITEFTAIINPPQTAILAVGSIQVVPGVEGGVAHSITATLSSDSRVLDYESSCLWLEEFRRVVEQPGSLALA